ncbi:hypothetical protein CC80DRAFT_226664 [Byssothecium circinans]|uniref:Uncharacterized protein n=1 Tax=Byssothecium circinans TaxID=147558 RepID=A0A6A5TDD6_9PLEO|nr:hypothetical protein CC80DRAFT_226664 [Byssothecium circinans]
MIVITKTIIHHCPEAPISYPSFKKNTPITVTVAPIATSSIAKFFIQRGDADETHMLNYISIQPLAPPSVEQKTFPTLIKKTHPNKRKQPSQSPSSLH